MLTYACYLNTSTGMHTHTHVCSLVENSFLQILLALILHKRREQNAFSQTINENTQLEKSVADFISYSSGVLEEPMCGVL